MGRSNNIVMGLLFKQVDQTIIRRSAGILLGVDQIQI
jgi:hypothetical protein